MPARVLTAAVTAAALTAGLMLQAVPPAWAADGSSGYSSTTGSASASGGQITVQAGVSSWTPPSGSTWATRSNGSPPPGKPNPNQPYGCRYQLAGPQSTQLLGPGGPTPGQWVFPICAGPGVLNPMPPFWVAQPQAQAAAVQVNPVVVAQQAISKLALQSPTIDMAPPTGDPQLVAVETWLWVNKGAWGALSATANAGPVTVTAAAAPVKVVWDMGNGNQVTCNGPGTPYDPSHPNATTNCSYTWPQAGTYQVTATIYWSVSWTAAGAPGGGNLGLQAGPAAHVAVTVTESQAINTPTGGGN